MLNPWACQRAILVIVTAPPEGRLRTAPAQRADQIEDPVQDDLEPRVTTRLARNHQPERPVNERPEQVKEGQDDESQPHGRDRYGEDMRQGCTNTGQPGFGVAPMPAIDVKRRQTAAAIAAAHRFLLNLLGTVRTTFGPCHKRLLSG